MNELIAIEQAERVKKWFRDYGGGIVLGIIFAIFVSLGWNYWHQSRENNLSIASMQYEHLVVAIISNENITTLKKRAEEIIKNDASTPYASLAALQLAKIAVNQNNLVLAANRLTWVVDHGHDQALRSIARMRLVRVLLAQNRPREALKRVSKNEDKAYAPIFLEEKGDIFKDLGYNRKALLTYLAAKQAFGNIKQPLLEMKINNLAGV
ncbi:hypothetical protein BEV13_02265 [Rickettsiella grylli]|uniref:YfgM family protein n=1 Tax=Rickettsiella grylli TaxID=59196 RepID=UPI0008FD39F6|nr:tetratricopeptide repeat protein [Rickettsiella grylli]OJA00820.1 hypothetical protein BEV13_02265 [Rickettsiella grylli]